MRWYLDAILDALFLTWGPLVFAFSFRPCVAAISPSRASVILCGVSGKLEFSIEVLCSMVFRPRELAREKNESNISIKVDFAASGRLVRTIRSFPFSFRCEEIPKTFLFTEWRGGWACSRCSREGSTLSSASIPLSTSSPRRTISLALSTTKRRRREQHASVEAECCGEGERVSDDLCWGIDSS